MLPYLPRPAPRIRSSTSRSSPENDTILVNYVNKLLSIFKFLLSSQINTYRIHTLILILNHILRSLPRYFYPSLRFISIRSIFIIFCPFLFRFIFDTNYSLFSSVFIILHPPFRLLLVLFFHYIHSPLENRNYNFRFSFHVSVRFFFDFFSYFDLFDEIVIFLFFISVGDFFYRILFCTHGCNNIFHKKKKLLRKLKSFFMDRL